MKPRTKRIVLVLFCLLLLGAVGRAWRAYSFVSRRLDLTRKLVATRMSMLKQNRLVPLPASAQQEAMCEFGPVLVGDFQFTRGFEMSFLAPPADIERWLQQSPGTRAVVPTTSLFRQRKFEVVPGGGASQAEVTVDDAQHRITIFIGQS